MKKLVACVNIMPKMSSVYWWDGKVNFESEELLIMKSTSDHFDAINVAVKELHPYECPELISFKVSLPFIRFSLYDRLDFHSCMQWFVIGID